MFGSWGASSDVEATRSTTWVGPYEVRVLLVGSFRLASDVVSGLTVNMDSRKRLGGVPVQSSGHAVRPNGDVPVRASGRYMQPSHVFATGAEWNYCNAIDFAQAGEGGRPVRSKCRELGEVCGWKVRTRWWTAT